MSERRALTWDRRPRYSPASSEPHMSYDPILRAHADLALAVYVEDLVRNKDVLYVGSPEPRVAERLGGSAQRVDLVPPGVRARGTRRGGRVRTRRWPTDDERGRWDVVLVPDLAEAGLATSERVNEARGWLKSGGVLVAATPDPDSPEAAAEPLSLSLIHI